MSIQRSDLPNEDARELPVEKVIRRARPLPPRERPLSDSVNSSRRGQNTADRFSPHDRCRRNAT